LRIYATTSGKPSIVLRLPLGLFTNAAARLKKCDRHLVDDYQQFKRSSTTYKPFTVFAFAQPLPAVIAIAGCFVVFACCSATWWDKKVTFSKVAIGYASPVILLSLFVLFKIINRRSWVHTSDDFAEFALVLDKLKWYKQDEIHASPQVQRNEATRVLSPPQTAADSDGSTHELTEIKQK
jgi:amino acid transporter